MPKESFPRKESPFEVLLRERSEQGWHYVGREGVTTTKFTDDARFVEVPFQTEDDIRKKYLDDARNADPASAHEVDLVFDETTDRLQRIRKISSDEEYQKILRKLPDQDKIYFVFLRKKEPAST